MRISLLPHIHVEQVYIQDILMANYEKQVQSEFHIPSLNLMHLFSIPNYTVKDGVWNSCYIYFS